MGWDLLLKQMDGSWQSLTDAIIICWEKNTQPVYVPVLSVFSS